MSRLTMTLMLMALLGLVLGSAALWADPYNWDDSMPFDSGSTLNDYMMGTPAVTYSNTGGPGWHYEGYWNMESADPGGDYEIISSTGDQNVYVFADVEMWCEEGMDKNIGYFHFYPGDEADNQSLTLEGYYNASGCQWISILPPTSDGMGNNYDPYPGTKDINTLRLEFTWSGTYSNWAVGAGLAPEDHKTDDAMDASIVVDWSFRDDNASGTAGPGGSPGTYEVGWRSNPDQIWDNGEWYLAGPYSPAGPGNTTTEGQAYHNGVRADGPGSYWFQWKCDTVGLDSVEAYHSLNDGHYTLDPLVCARPFM